MDDGNVMQFPARYRTSDRPEDLEGWLAESRRDLEGWREVEKAWGIEVYQGDLNADEVLLLSAAMRIALARVVIRGMSMTEEQADAAIATRNGNPRTAIFSRMSIAIGTVLFHDDGLGGA